MARTTIKLEDELFKEARKKAIDEGTTFAELINEALGLYLRKQKKIPAGKFTLKIYDLGRVKGSLRRSELYEHV